MATKKKTNTEVTPEEAAVQQATTEPEKMPEDAPAGDATAEGTATPEEGTTTEDAPAAENHEQITPDTSCPFEATVTAALAVLHKNIGLGTSETLRPVATLKAGTKVTVTAISGKSCQLKNGLWTSVEYLGK